MGIKTTKTATAPTDDRDLSLDTDEVEIVDEEETEGFEPPRQGRPSPTVPDKRGINQEPMPLHLHKQPRGTIYVPKGAKAGPSKVEVPVRKSDTVMW